MVEDAENAIRTALREVDRLPASPLRLDAANLLRQALKRVAQLGTHSQVLAEATNPPQSQSQ